MTPTRNWKASKMRLLRKWKDNKALRIAVLAVLAALAAISVIKGLQNAAQFSQDFQWDAAKALAMRLDPYELSMNPGTAAKYPELDGFYRMFTDRGLKQEMEANQFPSLLMLLFPMTALPPQVAKIVWAILNLLFTAGIIVFLRRTFFNETDPYEYAALSLLMLAGTPYRNQLGVGQHTLFSFFFFMLAVYIDSLPEEKRSGLRDFVIITVCLAISYFKYTLTAPLALYFIFRKRYREFAASVAIHAVLTVLAVIWLKKSLLYMLTAPLKVASVLTSEGGLDLGVFLPGGLSYAAGLVIAAVLVMIAVKLPEDMGNLLFTILILWSLVMTYHRTYDFFVFSAAAAMFTAGRNMVISGAENKESTDLMFVWYVILLLMLFFGLRAFDENTVSKIITGITYYAFAAAVTLGGIKAIRGKTNG